MGSGGSVTGGRAKAKPDQEGTFLAREREWRELPGRLAELSQAHQSCSSQLADQHEQVAALKHQIERLTVEQQHSHTVRQVQAEVEKINRTLEQLSSNLGWQQELQNKAGHELSRRDEREAEIRAEMARLEQEQQQAEAAVRQLARQVEALDICPGDS